jgi:hypothetical protein
MQIMTPLLAICLASILTGCVSVNIQSNTKAEATPEFHRILIESRLPETDNAYLNQFLTAFPAGYQVCTVLNSPTSFESPADAIEEKRHTCQSEVLLTIDFYRNYTSGSGKYITTTNELLLEMKNLSNGQSFWKALVKTSGSNEVPPNRIVSKLIDDGLVEGRLPGNARVQATN